LLKGHSREIRDIQGLHDGKWWTFKLGLGWISQDPLGLDPGPNAKAV
jgi:hypothetical protein